MKISTLPRCPRGYVSIVLVLSTGLLLTILLLYAYKHSLSSQSVEAEVQLNLDYAEKEDAMLRAILAATPNRAMRAMRSGSYAVGTREALGWDQIFAESITAANARNSISPAMLNTVKGTASALSIGNSGDSTLTTNIASIFSKIPSDTVITTGYVSSGLNRSLEAGFPAALNCVDASTNDRDKLYPIISSNKVYGAMADGLVGASTTDYTNLNILKYPKINFGYTTPGSPFVAKRNWWAFNLGLGGNDRASTGLPATSRKFVLSIYEIPSQLAISSSAYMSLGKFSSGDAWQNVSIEGNVFAGKADLNGGIALPGLASRRGTGTLELGSTIGGQSFTGNPMAVGIRENYQVTNGSFFPVSQASESGRVAFVPINRGTEFFDRFTSNDEIADNAVVPNTLWSRFSTLPRERRSSWDNYSQGAVQCAMRLDVTKGTATGITEVKLQYLKNGVMVSTPILSPSALPGDFGNATVYNEGTSYTTSTPVDIAYGNATQMMVKRKFTGTITFSNTGFGSNLTGTRKGYVSNTPAAALFAEVKSISTGDADGTGNRTALYIYPQRIKAYLALAGVAGDPVTVNNSLAVNVVYVGARGADVAIGAPSQEMISNYAVVLDECSDLRDFTKGFSLVTNLRLYIADDFNIQKIAAPTGYTGTEDYYPPCSIFAPEKRYGINVDPYAVNFTGQVGSVSSDTDAAVRPLDSKNKSGAAMSANRLTVNLKPITHPADIPPITMMNWLILLEEKTNQF